MVLQKRLDYGINGYPVPPIPHFPKSAKGKRSVRKKTVGSRMCAFDLLAAVAGKLLQEGESSSLPNKTIGTPNVQSGKEIVKEEKFKDEKPVKDKARELGSCAENTLGGNVVAQGKVTSEEACTKKQSPYIDKLDEGKIKGGGVVDQNASNMWGLEDKMDVVAKPHALASSDNSVKMPCRGDHVLNNSFSPKCMDEKLLLVNRDDDENYSGCINPSRTTNKALKNQGLGLRRMRKQLATKFWRVATTISKDRGLSNADVEMKQSFRNRQICYTRQRAQRSFSKRRRLFQRCSISTSHAGINCEDNKVSSSSIKGHLTSYGSEAFHVKLAVKSFKVPELFIEIPETSTVGSLKTTVMEAVTAILGGGLRVGVLFRGKKVRDDNKTLIQAGISDGDKLDDLGFTLEPNSSQSTPLLTRPEEPCLLLPSDAAETRTRFPVAVPTSDGGKSDFTPESPPTPIGNCADSDHDSIHSLAEKDACPLIAIPPISAEGLPVAPIHEPRQSDMAQRRIRRPFSVSEVEALVTAVEKVERGQNSSLRQRKASDLRRSEGQMEDAGAYGKNIASTEKG